VILAGCGLCPAPRLPAANRGDFRPVPTTWRYP
jgi:hypothetical protein